MTRCCSSFSNCSPEAIPVTVQNTTNVYQIGANQIGWRQERFAFADMTVGAGSILIGSVVMPFKAYVTLASLPATQHAVQVFFADGSVPQRPLVGAAGVPVAGDTQTYDYFISGQNVYLSFVPVDGDSLFVHYVGLPLAGSAGIATGDMDTIAVAALDDPSTSPSGWCLADGYTPYLKSAYPDLYAFLEENDLLSGNSVETDPATGQNGASHDIDDDTSFVIRYLVPYSYGAQGDDVDGTTHPARSLTHRVVIKA